MNMQNPFEHIGSVNMRMAADPNLTRQEAVHDITNEMIRARQTVLLPDVTVLEVPADLQKLPVRQGE